MGSVCPVSGPMRNGAADTLLEQKIRAAAVVVAVAASVLVSAGTPTTAAARQSCSDPASPKGDWPSFGHDIHNTRAQPDERTLGPSNVSSLKAQWSFSSSSDGGATGAFQSTPVEANGCLFMTSASISTP